MAATVVISFKDLDAVERVRSEVQRRCEALGEEFPETTRFEVILAADGSGYVAHGHVTGNSTEVAGHAAAPELAQAADKLLDNLQRQLRKSHQKKIFTRRRAAQRTKERQRSES